MAKTLVVQVAALSHELMRDQTTDCSIAGLTFQPIQSIFPAVTCSVQGTMRTGLRPGDHGIVGNGFYSRELQRPFFWEQSSSLMEGERIWRDFRSRGGTVGQLFWQQSLGTDSDVILSPAPIHKHHGGMIQDVFSRPKGLYERVCDSVGRQFNLAHYWGPRASRKASDWIVQATQAVMRNPAPDFLLTYLPHLDYDLQRSGPDSSEACEAFTLVRAYLEGLTRTAEQCGYEVVIFGDYAITPATNVLHPNRMLRDAGLFQPRVVDNMIYADLHTSRAFAMVDHQIGHVITEDRGTLEKAREVFEKNDGVQCVWGRDRQKERGIAHQRSGDLILQASAGHWFAYPWWSKDEKAPDYATHVDIHNKPGYDPAELFWGFWPFSTSQDSSQIKGTHGTVDSNFPPSWATNMPLNSRPSDLLDLSHILRDKLATGP